MLAAKERSAALPSRPSFAPNGKVSLPVASFVTLSGRDGTIKVRCLTRSSRRAATTGRKPTTVPLCVSVTPSTY
jgi:hypothetical protein